MPAVLVTSLLHPMEWIGLEVHMALLEDLLREDAGIGAPGQSAHEPLAMRPSSSAAAASPARSSTPGNAASATRVPLSILSIPVANPDGFARVEASLLDGRPRWVRGNAARVDLNRNFPVGHRARPALLVWWPVYRPGPSALSEPETKAIAAWIEGKSVRLSLSLHSFGRRVFVPPARAWRPLPETASMLATALTACSGSGYRAGQLGRWSPFFRARGTEIDFLHEVTQAPAFLVEISRGGFGRWGARRLWQPFCLFNPPRPATEIARVLPALRGLINTGGMAGATPGPALARQDAPPTRTAP